MTNNSYKKAVLGLECKVVSRNLYSNWRTRWCHLSVIPGTTQHSGKSTQKVMVTFRGLGEPTLLMLVTSVDNGTTATLHVP